MPQGDKSNYSAKQKRMAGHIEESYDERGARKKDAERIAWASVNKETGDAHGLSKSSSDSLSKAKSVKSSLSNSTRGAKSRKSDRTESSRTRSASRKKNSR